MTPLHAAALAALLPLLPVPSAPQAAPAEPLSALLVPVEAPAAGTPGLGEVVLRERAVALRLELLEDAAARPGAELRLPLFDDVAPRVGRVRAEPGLGGVVWHGEVLSEDGATIGSATLSAVGGVAAGSVRVSDRLYRIGWLGAGVHRVSELDEERFPVCATDERRHAVAPPGPSAAPAGGAIAASTNLPTVDVLVVYTSLAKNNEGGTAAMQALINLAVSETNQAYQSSDVSQRLRLVHAAELTGYTENGNFNTELARLSDTNDGYNDVVHAWRDQYGADEVAMIVNSSQYCGIAYLMTNVSNGFESNAFNVTSRTCATGYYSFGHELGHNMGSHHDAGNAGGAAFPYSYGWRTANGQYRTILAYAPGTRIQFFSNHNKSYNGQILGQANSAENWRSLNDTAATSSQWRCAKGVNYGAAKTTSLGGAAVVSYSGKPVFDGSGGFQVELQGAVPFQPAIVFYGDAQTSAPFFGGTLLVAPPTLRLPVQFTDGAGNASYSFPIASYNFGDEIYLQGWFRDPGHPDGTGIGLSNGLRIDVCRYDN